MLASQLLAAAFVSAFALSASALADENNGRTASGERGGRVSRTLTFCDGGATEAVFTNTQDAPASTTSAVFVDIPSTTAPGGSSGVGADSDVYTVTLNGEASATLGGNWEVQLLVSVNGGAFFAMNPIGPNTFHTGNAAQTKGMKWCNRLVATGSTTFKAQWRKLGGGTAVIDDYTLQVVRSN